MAHTFYSLHYHIIFSTKHREPLIDNSLKDRLFAYMAGIINNGNGFTRKINGTADHVHILADVKPKIALSNLLRDIKSNSSGWVHDTFPEKSKFGWQIGYGIFSVSESNIERVIDYIENQEEHHKKRTFKEEFLKFLQRHHIEYDESHLWD
ncbi:MAG TPA: IS200/IS605 family transposase [Caldithrix sp.]|nr:IS200/IS605 family transposase [Caldithrix sp.]